MRPGKTSLPDTSRTSLALSFGIAACTAATRPSCMATSRTPSMSCAGSITRPPLNNTSYCMLGTPLPPPNWRGQLPCAALGLPTTTVNHLAGDERGIVRGQKSNRRRLLLGPPRALYGLLVPDVLTHLLAVCPRFFRVKRLSHHPGSDSQPRRDSIRHLCAAWRHRIDPDTVAAVLHGQHFGEGEYAALTHGIR